MSNPKSLDIIPNEAFRGVKPYSVLERPTPIDLWLDANEGPTRHDASFSPPLDAERARRYPSTDELRLVLAARLGVAAERVAVTAGGDDAIDRACRAVLKPGREIILTPPTFEMFHRYAAITGATEINVPWRKQGFPTDEVLARLTERTAAIAVVSPNNPSGLAATAADLRRIASAAPGALVIADLAYAEFADEDLQAAALEFPNAVAIRTLSKAWGLAGLRVGYAVGDPRVITWIRAAGGPYAVSAASAAIAARTLEHGEPVMRAYVDRVRFERAELFELLEELGYDPWPSQANFVTTGASDGPRRSPFAGLERRGIAVREWRARRDLPAHAVRITCPGSEAAFGRLCRALRETAAEN